MSIQNKTALSFFLLFLLTIIISAGCVGNDTHSEQPVEDESSVKSVDVIDGFPLYILQAEDFDISQINDSQNREAIKHSNAHGNTPVIIFCDADLYDFRVSNLSIDDDVNFYFEDTVFHIEKLTPDYFIEYMTELPCGIPFEAISFMDKSGKIHSYVLHNDGEGTMSIAQKTEILLKRANL